MTQRLTILFLAAIVFMAQAQDRSATVTGRLRARGETLLHGYVIEFENLATHQSVRADVEDDGDFTIRNLPCGDYIAKITTWHGETIAQQFASIPDRAAFVEFRLPDSGPRPTGATVSVGELRHPPARKAIEAAAAAQRFSNAGRYDQAITQLEKAILISPDFGAAHSNLGAQYVRAGRYGEGRAEIERAMQIAGPNARDLSNLAFAQAGLSQLPEAVQSARRAVAMDGANAQAQYVLGSLLALRPETRQEGVAHLETAASSLECARNLLASLKR